ncbi:MAG TPA: SRPBCC domain-containing protein [Jiangellaceae bacterium]
MSALVTVRRRITAPVGELFDAWLDPVSLAAWMRPRGISRSEAEVDARTGGAFRIVMTDAHHAIVHTGIYHEIDRPRRLAFSWRSPATDDRESLVIVDFTPDGDGTIVEIRHDRLPHDEARRSHTDGWTDVLSTLDTHVTI